MSEPTSDTNNNNTSPTASPSGGAAKPKKKASPDKVAERVYQLMLEDARRERERRG